MDVFYYHLQDIKNQLNRIEIMISAKGYFDNWLTLKDSKIYTNLSESTLRRAIAKGELKRAGSVEKYY